MNKLVEGKDWKPADNITLSDIALRVVTSTSQNLLVIAGPGAGKTELLAQRACYLLQTGSCKIPQKILALCFKVDAAANLKNRVEKRCGKELAVRFESRTFDSFFISIAQRFSVLLPSWIKFKSDFEVVAFNRDWWTEYERLSGINLPGTYKNGTGHSPLNLSDIQDIEVRKIWSFCMKQNIADFAMCRSMAYTILKNNKQVKSLLLATYKFLFLDEFQDATNDQYEFIKNIFYKQDALITAVGDNNQMIMGWAGATIENFTHLQNDFTSENIFLPQNHRSNKKIVDLINHVITDLTPEGEEPIRYEATRLDLEPECCIGARSFQNRKDEGTYMSQYISSLLEKNSNLNPSDFVLILRQRADLYYQEVVDIFKEKNLSLRNEDELATKDGIKIQELMAEPLSCLLILLLRSKNSTLSYESEKELKSSLSHLKGYDLNDDRDHKRVNDLIMEIVSVIDLSSPVDKWLINVVKIVGIKELRSAFPQYKSLYLKKTFRSFLDFFSKCFENNGKNLCRAIDQYEGRSQIKLMTIHKSKGLEFNTVFFADFNTDSWWGLERAIIQNNVTAQREEKNSFLVGMSRAKDRLYFTSISKKWPPVILKLLNESKLLVKMPDLL